MFNERNVIYRYKYLPFTSGSLKTLTEGTIKFTCPLDFNDPFDCVPYYDENSLTNLYKERPDLLKEVAIRNGWSPAKRIQEKKKTIANIRAKILDGSFAKDVMSNVGVVSLSKNPLNILMWSHYAEYHKGFVLELRIPVAGTKQDVAYSNDRLTPLGVDYSIHRPIINLVDHTPSEIVEKAILTKSIDWSYEEEERVIDHDRGPGVYAYRRDEILTSVIVGARMSIENYSTMRGYVVDLKKTIPNLILYKAIESKNEYKILVPNHPRLGRD